MTTTENSADLLAQAAVGNADLLKIPTFDTVDEERTYRKQRLAGALRIFGRLGFGEGVAGHITVRDPELTDHFWVNPFGLSFRHMRV
ncbi:MAG: class II aldolase/adducin family protein, partial [Ilumatobacteraceae bacterium]